MRGELPILNSPVNPDNPIVYLDIAIGPENGKWHAKIDIYAIDLRTM